MLDYAYAKWDVYVFPSPMRIDPCVDLAVLQPARGLALVVSIPYEETPVSTMAFSTPRESRCSVSIPYEDSHPCRLRVQRLDRESLQEVSIPYED